MRVAAASLLICLAFPAAAQTADAPISTRTDAEEGTYLVDGNGMSVYLFRADTQGREGTPPRSACEDACLAAWPPLVVGEAPLGDDGVDASLLGTFTRGDGLLQATYNGWPLYYYVGDAAPGDITGHDFEDFGEEWYLIGPNGLRAGEDGDDDRDDKDDDSDDGNDSSGPGGGDNDD
jgi:predicted lipoprotein with Yx(FWY)xxD motif